ncbi:MAG: acyl-CoA mutase large subunit family protein [Selenomonadaceae bacterium]|nr:acyl-CoA mutase large subunit family protein [Selenomonadaceae bacterium]
MSNATEKNAELDLQALIKKAEAQETFPEVPLDEFSIPSYDEWKAACIALLKGADFNRKLYTKTYENITFSPMYFHGDTEAIQPVGSFPGMGDYLRGVKANGYVNAPWGIAQACDETLPEENNALLKHEIDKGSTVYHVKVDCATRKGKDARECKHIGKHGCSVTTLGDVETLLKGLKLDQHPLYVYAGESALPLLALIVAAVKKNGGDVSKLCGIIGANPIAEYAANGKLTQDLDKLFDEAAKAAKWAVKNAPAVKTVFVKSNVFSNGGANDVQEVAYTLATGVAYLRALLERGLTIDEAAGQIMFGFSMGANFFLQIAKLRAIRPIWAQIIQAFGGNEESQKIHIHGRPAKFFKTVYDPYVNMLRDTTELFSGVVGGVDSFENSTFDEPVRKGDEFSRRIARNMQIILQEEFGLLQPIDPAGGSWAVENLTKEIKEKIWAEFQVIEGKGGIVAALKEGYPQEQIAAILDARFKAAETRKDRIVGNNMYPNMTEERIDARPENQEENLKARKAAIENYLSTVDSAAVADALAAVKDGCACCAIAAAEKGATIAEIRNALGTAEVPEIKNIEAHRWSERFEALREKTEKFKAATGDNVKIFLANMGPIPQHKARADFTTGFLQVGAFQVMGNNGFKTVEEAAEAAKASGADAAVICSTDATYPEIIPALAPKLHEALPNATVFLAGAAPADLKATYDAAGIDEYIHVKANCYQILQALQQKKGMN